MTAEETWNYSIEERKTGIKLTNTRIIETKENDRPCLGIFGAFLEFERLGIWNGTWSVQDTIKVRDFINDWLKRTGVE